MSNLGQPPQEKPTVEFDKPPAWAISLMDRVNVGFTTIDSRLSGIETNQDIQGAAVQDLAKRVTAQDARIDQINERLSSNSERAKSSSEVDLKHDASIGELHTKTDANTTKLDALDTKVEALANKPDTAAVVLTEMKKLAGLPIMQKIGTAAAALVVLVLSLLGMKLQAQISALEHKPETVQPAPTVYFQVPMQLPTFDGGVK